jgi:hypothetical protein
MPLGLQIKRRERADRASQCVRSGYHHGDALSRGQVRRLQGGEQVPDASGFLGRVLCTGSLHEAGDPEDQHGGAKPIQNMTFQLNASGRFADNKV